MKALIGVQTFTNNKKNIIRRVFRGADREQRLAENERALDIAFGTPVEELEELETRYFLVETEHSIGHLGFDYIGNTPDDARYIAKKAKDKFICFAYVAAANRQGYLLDLAWAEDGALVGSIAFETGHIARDTVDQFDSLAKFLGPEFDRSVTDTLDPEKVVAEMERVTDFIFSPPFREPLQEKLIASGFRLKKETKLLQHYIKPWK